MADRLKWGAGGLQELHAERMDNIAAAGTQANTDEQLRATEAAKTDDAIKTRAAAMMSEMVGGKTTTKPTGEEEGTPTSMSDAFAQTGDKLIKLGFVEAGMDYHKNSSTLRKDEDDAVKSDLARQKAKGELLTSQADLVASQLGNAGDDPEAWQQGLQNLQDSGQFTPEQMASFRSIPPSAVAADILRARAIKAKDQVTLDIQQQNLDIRRTDSERAEANRQRLSILARERFEEAKRVRERANSTGAAATAPTKPELEFVTRAIQTEIFKGTKPTNPDIKLAMQAGADQIASRAKELVRNDRSLSWDVAVNRAVLESQALGDWEGMVDVTKVGIFETGRSESDVKKYKPKGKTPDAPLPMPTTKKALAVGRYYDTPRGPARWTGSAFTTD